MNPRITCDPVLDSVGSAEHIFGTTTLPGSKTQKTITIRNSLFLVMCYDVLLNEWHYICNR